MTTELLAELVENPRLIYRYTVAEYQRMIPAGIIEEGAPYELLDGQVVHRIRSATGEDPMTTGEDHVYAVMKLTVLFRQFEEFGCHGRLDQPMVIPPHHEPEPDLAVVKGTIDDYMTRMPTAADVICIVEVADASLQRDRTVKQRIYAAAGIPMYVIVNLLDRSVEVYTEPARRRGRYAQMTRLTGSQRLSIPTLSGKSLTFPIRQLFGK